MWIMITSCKVNCIECKGTGYSKWEGGKCPACRGNGSVMVTQPPQKCLECEGTGLMSGEEGRCPTCGGSGWAGTLR